MTFVKYNDRLLETLTIIREELLAWASADAEGSLDAGAVDQAHRDMYRVRKLQEAERLLKEAFK